MRKSKKLATLVTVVAAAGLLISGCSSPKRASNPPTGSSSSSSKVPKAAKVDYSAAVDNVVNRSSKTGGTVRYEIATAPDSFDPGNTSAGFMWDFSRLYARPMVTFKSTPGTDGLTLVPDLATGLGKVSDDGLTWTYTLRQGIEFQDGTAVTSKDVKYAIERSNYAPTVLSDGPAYFKAYLKDNTPAYSGPYKDPAGGLNSIETPDPNTIIFHLNKPFAEFDDLLANSESAPVEQSKDGGASYAKSIQSTGPYEFESYQAGKSAVLVRNPTWSKSTDALDNALPDEIDVKMGVAQATIDRDLLAGSIQGDLAGAGVLPTTQAAVLTEPSKKANADAVVTGTLTYLAVNTTVAPLTNVDCRKAVEYAVDKLSVQRALGGPVSGQIATQLLPPSVSGYSKIDPYPSTNDSGDVEMAKSELVKCGEPDGFAIGLTARSDEPDEVNTAMSIQASLKVVGINATIQQYPSSKYFSDFAGAKSFASSHDIGLILTQWSAPWPTGFGFLDQILDGAWLKPSGNTNLSYLNDPAINADFAKGIATADASARNAIWADIDKTAMADAVIVPLVDSIDLLYRPPSATNVFVTQWVGMYDYTQIGVTG